MLFRSGSPSSLDADLNFSNKKRIYIFIRCIFVGPEILDEVTGIFPRFLRWLPKHCLSMPSRRSLEIWCLVIKNLTANDMSQIITWPFVLVTIYPLLQLKSRNF